MVNHHPCQTSKASKDFELFKFCRGFNTQRTSHKELLTVAKKTMDIVFSLYLHGSDWSTCVCICGCVYVCGAHTHLCVQRKRLTVKNVTNSNFNCQ